MKQYICLAIILLSTAELNAETYSWVDDRGTYNFTEDYSSVPKKYRNKVKLRGDGQQDEKLRQEEQPQQMRPGSASLPKNKENGDDRRAVVPSGDKELYGGKTRDAWRAEMDALEAELTGIEQKMEQMRQRALNVKGLLTKAELETLKKDYEESRSNYNQKYRSYTELLEAARKGGLVIEIKK